MAKQTTTKKTTTKKTKAKVDLTKVEEVLENVNTEIKIEGPEIEVLKDDKIEELTEIIDEVNKSEEQLKEAIEESPEKASELIQKEIEKAEVLKEKVEKITRRNITTTWNGMYID